MQQIIKNLFIMSISEYLQKQDPPKTAFEGLSGAGLGMAGTFILHSRIATYLAKEIDWFPDKKDRNFYYEAVVEAREDKGAKAQIYDICVKRFNYNNPRSYGENVIIIEITNSEADERKAFERIDRVREKGLYEAFIFNYIENVWRGFHVDDKKQFVTSDDKDDKINFHSDFLGINFKERIEKFFSLINYKPNH